MGGFAVASTGDVVVWPKDENQETASETWPYQLPMKTRLWRARRPIAEAKMAPIGCESMSLINTTLKLPGGVSFHHDPPTAVPE